MDVQKILSSIVNGLTNSELKSDAGITPKKVILFSGGQYYNGSDYVSVSGSSSSEFVQKALVGLSEKYRDVVPTFPSAKDEPPTGEAPTGASCKWYVNSEY